jgi:hypothetical protein
MNGELALAPVPQHRLPPTVEPRFPPGADPAAGDLPDGARGGSGKVSDDLAKAGEGGVAAGGAASPEAGSGGAQPLADDTGTVPQATWSPPEAPPVPPPAPRFARLSEVLEQGGAPRGAPRGAARGAAAADVPSRPQAARRAAEDAAPVLGRQVAAAASAILPRPEAPQRVWTSASPRIVVHYRGEAGASAARRVAAELRARGYGRTELRPVSFAVAQANVRYFHDQNRPVAREVNELLGSMWRRSDLRDFTGYAPLPSVGTVEVWLPG